MAARRNGDHGVAQYSRRSQSSTPPRSSALPARSRSPSPRKKRLRRAEEEGEVGRGGGRRDDRDRDTRDRDRLREREYEEDRARSRAHGGSRDHGRDRDHRRDRDYARDKDHGRDRDRDRDRSTRDEDRTRDRRGRERERPRDRMSPRSPAPHRPDRSPSSNLEQRHQPSPPETSPHHQRRGSKHDQRANTGMLATARDEDGVDAVVERSRNDGSPQEENAISRMKEVEAALDAKESNKEKPSFEYTGKLAAETNKIKGVALQFTEPPEARKPSTRWRLYVFKDGEALNEPLYIHRKTSYLVGRERRVADIPTDHPSCSKQHAVIQYRLTEKEDADGKVASKVRPYVMDLGSTNGTTLNGEKLDPQRYYEMFEKDTIKFGHSSREYVLLHEHSAG